MVGTIGQGRRSIRESANETHGHDHVVKKRSSAKRRVIQQDVFPCRRFDHMPAERDDSVPPQEKRVPMKTPPKIPLVKAAILTLAEIKAAVEAFDRGESNVFDALDAIVIAIKVSRSAVSDEQNQSVWRRDAA